MSWYAQYWQSTRWRTWGTTTTSSIPAPRKLARKWMQCGNFGRGKHSRIYDIYEFKKKIKWNEKIKYKKYNLFFQHRHQNWEQSSPKSSKPSDGLHEEGSQLQRFVRGSRTQDHPWRSSEMPRGAVRRCPGVSSGPRNVRLRGQRSLQTLQRLVPRAATGGWPLRGYPQRRRRTGGQGE